MFACFRQFLHISLLENIYLCAIFGALLFLGAGNKYFNLNK